MFVTSFEIINVTIFAVTCLCEIETLGFELAPVARMAILDSVCVCACLRVCMRAHRNIRVNKFTKDHNLKLYIVRNNLIK
jgi:hypothetical protein